MSAKTKTNTKSVHIRLNEKIKSEFEALARSEQMQLSEAVEMLMLEAISRGYINKTKHVILTKS